MLKIFDHQNRTFKTQNSTFNEKSAVPKQEALIRRIFILHIARGNIRHYLYKPEFIVLLSEQLPVFSLLLILRSAEIFMHVSIELIL